MTRRYYREVRLKGYDDRKCLNCNSTKTHIYKDGRKQWHLYKDGRLCKKCFNNLIQNPKLNKKWNGLAIRFLGIRIFLSFNPRKGYCSWCPSNIFDGTTERTHMHHWFYVRILPWACTEEICNSCHTTHHQRKIK